MVACLGLALGCDKLPDDAERPVEQRDFLGTLGQPFPAANAEQRAAFARGAELVRRRFTPSQGLGPDFNASFCAACHEKPVVGGAAGRYRNFQIVMGSEPDGAPVPRGKRGIQTHFHLQYVHAPDAEDVEIVAVRNPIPFFGVGLLAELPEEILLANEDPEDVDGNGISGRANRDHGRVGRFGRKAQSTNLEAFVRAPMFTHVGVTSAAMTPDARTALQALLAGAPDPVRGGGRLGLVEQAQATVDDALTEDNDGVSDPELQPDELFDIMAFVSLLAGPAPSPETPESRHGSELFTAIGCDLCHVRTLRGPRGPVPAYSDLLLHDMGPELADGVEVGSATGSEFRTAPLWGVVAVAPYLHDGRADTLDEAIVAHGGEAGPAREAYQALDEAGRRSVLAFLATLGGAEQASEGLLPPGEPVPAAGSLGGPERPLSEDQVALFAEGRRLFDQDMAISSGLGRRFNGDSCRACHFDPVLGGAGPLDVNVTRQGIAAPDGVTPPPGGTTLHRFANVGHRPAPDAVANAFVLRQTPALFGIGAIDRIPDEVIIANADPDDVDGDGVSGRPRRLADGRLGRFGWKANVPTVQEFLRDALGTEMGHSVPARPEQTFGFLDDDDEASDPETTTSEYDAMLFFLEQLGPPVSSPPDAEQHQRGAARFEAAGCSGCHVPALEDADGALVALYSDLLLHDVQPPDINELGDGDAAPREFRTPPLWGVGNTAPYWHNGAAETLRAAILRHAGEASNARRRFEALDQASQADLLAFLTAL